jgi:hypothetical protein
MLSHFHFKLDLLVCHHFIFQGTLTEGEGSVLLISSLM